MLANDMDSPVVAILAFVVSFSSSSVIATDVSLVATAVAAFASTNNGRCPNVAGAILASVAAVVTVLCLVSSVVGAAVVVSIMSSLSLPSSSSEFLWRTKSRHSIRPSIASQGMSSLDNQLAVTSRHNRTFTDVGDGVGKPTVVTSVLAAAAAA